MGKSPCSLLVSWRVGEILSLEVKQTLRPFFLLTSFLVNNKAARSCSVESEDPPAGSL